MENSNDYLNPTGYCVRGEERLEENIVFGALPAREARGNRQKAETLKR
jgi:hypothetical protein